MPVDRDDVPRQTIEVLPKPTLEFAEVEPAAEERRRAWWNEVFGTVESVKAVSDLFAPVTGKVVKVNTPIHDTPEAVNEDPYDDGWLIEIEMSDIKQAAELLSAEQYREFLAEQS